MFEIVDALAEWQNKTLWLSALQSKALTPQVPTDLGETKCLSAPSKYRPSECA
jgi:hypothetical protein